MTIYCLGIVLTFTIVMFKSYEPKVNKIIALILVALFWPVTWLFLGGIEIFRLVNPDLCNRILLDLYFRNKD